MATTLRDIHADSKKKFTQAHAELRAIAPSVAPKSLAGFQLMIRRGTTHAILLGALSTVYGVPFPQIVEAAQASREVEKKRVKIKQFVINPLRGI